MWCHNLQMFFICVIVVIIHEGNECMIGDNTNLHEREMIPSGLLLHCIINSTTNTIIVNVTNIYCLFIIFAFYCFSYCLVVFIYFCFLVMFEKCLWKIVFCFIFWFIACCYCFTCLKHVEWRLTAYFNVILVVFVIHDWSCVAAIWNVAAELFYSLKKALMGREYCYHLETRMYHWFCDGTEKIEGWRVVMQMLSV